MTPAERLAAKKPWRRSPRNKQPYQRKATWVCLIRERREALRLSLRDVAQALQISMTALWQIEKGGDPMLTTATTIAAFFGVPISELWPKRAKQPKR